MKYQDAKEIVCHSVKKGVNVLLIGPKRSGKTHMLGELGFSEHCLEMDGLKGKPDTPVVFTALTSNVRVPVDVIVSLY